MYLFNLILSLLQLWHPSRRLAAIRAIERLPNDATRLARWVTAVAELADGLERSPRASAMQTELVEVLSRRMRIGQPTRLRWQEQRVDALHDMVADRLALAASLRRFADAARDRGLGRLNLETMLMRKVEWRARDLFHSVHGRHAERERPADEAPHDGPSCRGGSIAEHRLLITQIVDHAAAHEDAVYRDVIAAKLEGRNDSEIARELKISRAKVQRLVARLRRWVNSAQMEPA